MCRFIVCIIYIHRYTSFLTEVALTKAGSSRKLSWPIALCFHSNFFLQDLCHEYFRKTWSFSRLMACWQRRGKINHLQIQSVLYFSLYEKTGSSLTLCHPSTNAPNIIKLLNISCGDKSVLLTAFTKDVLFFTPLGKIKTNWYRSL